MLLKAIQERGVQQGFILPLFAPHYQIAAKANVQGLGFEPQLDAPSSAYEIWIGK